MRISDWSSDVCSSDLPTVWLGLVEHLEREGGEVSTLERILVGGAPMPPALMERIERRLGAEVQTSWGMTELSPLGTAAVPGDPGRTAGVSGKPAIGVDLLLTAAAGRALDEQRGREGALGVRGDRETVVRGKRVSVREDLGGA